jgi:hypothetical protein
VLILNLGGECQDQAPASFLTILKPELLQLDATARRSLLVSAYGHSVLSSLPPRLGGCQSGVELSNVFFKAGSYTTSRTESEAYNDKWCCFLL